MTTSHLNLNLTSTAQYCEGEISSDKTSTMLEVGSPHTQTPPKDSDSYQNGLGRQREVETPFPSSPSRFSPSASVKIFSPTVTGAPLPEASSSFPFWQKALVTGGAALLFPYAIVPAAALALLTTLSGCGGSDASEGANPETSGANSAACETHRHDIESYKPDSKYQAMLDAVEFTTVDFAGLNAVDSEKRAIKSFKPSKSDVVDYVAVDNKLFVLTRNKIPGGFAPATLLIYQINGTKLTPASPNQAVVLYPLYNPVWMAPSGTQQLHMLFGPPSSDLIVSFDAKAMKVIDANWCDPKSGTSGPDGGTDAAGGHGGSGGTAGHAGTGGAAGTAGHSGGGSAGAGGHGGSSGSAGHAGAGGAGGHGGSSGSVGKGGAAGAAGKGGAGGTAGGAGKGGTAGSSGKGGTGGIK